ncbi:hypothetical protein [Virgibacillus kimchii]
MKKLNLLFLILLFTVGCDETVAEEDIIDGKWIATAGFEDGEVIGEASCSPFQYGIEFIDQDTVYVEWVGREFKYWLSENEEGSTITFEDDFSDSLSSEPGSDIYFFQIKMLNTNEMVLEGDGMREGHNCYLERGE